jgi:excisionase family DNA binding protein
MIEEQAFSVSRLAKRLGVSQRTARRIVGTGEVKAYRIGRQWRVFEPDLQDYLANQVNRHAGQYQCSGETPHDR